MDDETSDNPSRLDANGAAMSSKLEIATGDPLRIISSRQTGNRVLGLRSCGNSPIKVASNWSLFVPV
jgi:hypothetical protein